MNGVNVKATILQIKYDRDQRINNHYSAILTLRYHWHEQELQGIRGVIFPAQDQSEVQVNQLINIRVHGTTHNISTTSIIVMSDAKHQFPLRTYRIRAI